MSSDTLRERANELFKSLKYEAAVEEYSKAIEVDPDNATLFSNRSAAHLKAGNAEEALLDAQRCTELRPNWEKSHFRQGAALEELRELDQALMAFQAALLFDQNNKELIGRIKQLKQKIKLSKEAAKSADRETFRDNLRQNVNVGGPLTIREGPLDPTSWAVELSTTQQAEWFVDCYRMRVDDDACWGGGWHHGLYTMDTTTDIIAEDFLIFCKLAVTHNVIPPGWDWDRVLQCAAKLLPYAFEKADAKEKWGGENIFRGMCAGGRSLRFTAEMAYGFSCMGPANWAGEETARFRSMRDQIRGFVSWQGLVEGGSELFNNVGGLDVWSSLHKKLFIPSGNW